MAHNPDLWIWRDRWEDMGKIFQDRYITGVLDAVEALTWFDSPDGSRLSLAVHLAHSKMASRFPTVRSAVEWVSEEVAKEPDPLTIVAATTITRLLTLDQVTGLQIQFHNGAIWKDRWQRDWWIPGFFADGYPRPGRKRAAKRFPAFLLVPRHAALDGAGGVVSVPRWFDTDLR